MRFFLFAISSIFCFLQHIHAQNTVLDSLKQSLPLQISDSNAINKLLKISQVARLTDYEEAIQYATKAIDESKKTHWERGLFKGYYQAAVGFFSTYQIDSSLIYLDSAQAIGEEINEIKSIPIIYELKANIYSAKGAFFKALDTYKKAIDFQVKNKIEVGLEYTYNNVAKLYYDLNDQKKGYAYAQKAYELAHAHKDTFVLGIILLNLGANTPNIKEKKRFFEEAITMSSASGDNNTLGIAYNNLGGYYTDLQDPDSIHLAIHYVQKGLNLSGIRQNPELTARFLKNLADDYYQLNQIDSAQYYIEQAEAILPDIWALDTRKDFYFVKAQITAAKGDYSKAFEAQNKMMALTDSIYSEELVKSNAFFDAQFKNDEQQRLLLQKEVELSREQAYQSKIIGWGSLSLFLVATFFGWFYIRQYRQKEAVKRKLMLETSKNETLQNLDRLKSEFFSNISHELRTPLTLISGPLGNIKAQSAPTNFKREINLAYNNSKKLLSLVNDILDLTKLESDKLELIETPIHLLPWLKRTFMAFESYANNLKIDLQLETDIPNDLHIKTDDKKLGTILNNLLANAIKFSKLNSKVSLMATINTGLLQIKVKDEGIGIHPDDRDKIFEKFYQSLQKNKSKSGGTGIGLALAKKLSHLLGGDLRFESIWQQGTTFTLTLPVEVSLSSQEVAAPIEPSMPTNTYQPILINGKKPSILLVEDQPEMQSYLFGILEKDYRVQTAGNGQKALEQLQQQHFDLIISDIMMPIMDGFEFKEKVNKQDNYRLIPFIFLSAKSLTSDKIAGFQLGVDDYITKPFEQEELLARINILLKNKLERQVWQQQEKEQLPDPQESTAEQKLLKDLEAYILKNIDNPKLKVTDIAKELAYSQRQLSRLVKKWTGMTVVNLLLEIRLQKAHQLISEKKYRSVTEVMMEVGIESPSYFSSKYKARFGRLPSAS